MNELVIDIKGKTSKYHFPDAYEHFKLRHLKIFNRYLESGDKNEYGYPKFVVDFFGIPKEIWKQLDGENLFWSDVVADEEGQDEVVMHPELKYLDKPYSNNKSLLRWVGIWSGPKDRFSNICIEQIGFVSGFANDYTENISDEMLDLFFAALYRLPFFGFSKYLISLNKALCWTVSKQTKQAALLNFRGMMVANKRNHPHVYSDSGESDGTERFAWEGTIQKLAKTAVFGSYRQAKKTKFTQAMIHFEMNGIEVKRANDRLKKQKK